jgi:hypothetical protein
MNSRISGSSNAVQREESATNGGRVKLRHEDEALEVCKGIVLGLYRAEHRGFELLEYAEDSPSELASHAVEIWRRRRRHCTFPRNFVEKCTPNWAWLVR